MQSNINWFVGSVKDCELIKSISRYASKPYWQRADKTALSAARSSSFFVIFLGMSHKYRILCRTVGLFQSFCCIGYRFV